MKLWSSRHQEASPIDLQGIQRPLSSNCLSHALSRQAKPHHTLQDWGRVLVREGECKRSGPGANRTRPTTRQGGRVQEERTGSQQNSAHYSSGRESARGVDPGANRSGPLLVRERECKGSGPGANRSGATTRQGGRVQEEWTPEPTDLGPLLVRERECKRSGPGANRSGATTRQEVTQNCLKIAPEDDSHRGFCLW
ncbi:unnamed protein product [Arctogadus glacialis]